MKTVSLSGALRSHVGKKDAKSLRKAERVPCVLYGGKEQMHFSVAESDLRHLIFTPNVYKIELDVDGKKSNVIIKDMQYHPISDKAIHVDFLELFDDKEVNVKLPVKIVGNSPGVLAGGKRSQNFRKLTVRGLPKDMVEFIEVDVTPLNIGDSVRVRDIQIPGLTLIDAASAVVIAIKMARGASKAEQEEDDAAAALAAAASEESAATAEAAAE